MRRTSGQDVNGDGFTDLVLHFENTRLRGVLIDDVDGDDPDPTDDTLYLFGIDGGNLFIGIQQSGDPLKIIGR